MFEEEEADNVIWIKVSDEEMIGRYGPNSIKDKLSEDEGETVSGRCKRKPSKKEKVRSDYEYTVEEVE